jgi:Xaa-Pro aminopeptidase
MLLTTREIPEGDPSMTPKTVQLKISGAEFLSRQEKLLEHLQTRELSGAILFDRDYILYYSGFAFIPTERPIALLLNTEPETALFVPQLEVEHAERNPHIDRVLPYVEYPDETHPMQSLTNKLGELGIKGRIGADEDGYPWVLGYRGPSLRDLTSAEIIPLRSFIEDQMMIKSPAELDLIRESVRWGNLAHTLLQRYTKVGKTETDVSQRASDEATRAMLDAIGPIYSAQSPFGGGAQAGYRGQIGRHAAIPHAMAANITFQAGDVLVTGASAPVWGYVSELERTMIIGSPSDEQSRFFNHMLALQNLAFEALGPGVKCTSVDRKVRGYYEEHNLEKYWRHHTGHAIGLRYHEGPFLDIGDDTLIQPGMVFTVEPGLYVPKLGGFRHSDTVVITETGIELLTYYPRDLDSLTLPA